jgi:glycosyltransferase involved in cell wall biosynthesis
VEFANSLSIASGKNVELLIAGNVPEKFKKNVPSNITTSIKWLGIVPHENILELDQSAHLFFPAEINAACPNSVVEALACGLPVVGYATGSIAELVGSDGGSVVPYGADHWKLEKPAVDKLVSAALNILENLPQYQRSAREHAEAQFGLDRMVEGYLKILLEA